MKDGKMIPFQSKWKGLLKKRWFVMSLYVSVLLLLIGVFAWRQFDNGRNEQVSQELQQKQEVREVQGQIPSEKEEKEDAFILPIKEGTAIKIKKHFYEYTDNHEKRQEALFEYKNRYLPNTGIQIQEINQKPFEVYASMGGKVKEVREDGFLGNEVVIEHSDTITTHYQSIENFVVKIGDEVKQGQQIGISSKSILNQSAGNHLHFEIRKSGIPLNPEKIINKKISDVGVNLDKKVKTR